MKSPETATQALAEVGAQLRRHRLRAGMTLNALAQATGISTSTLSRLESGRRKPGLDLLLPVVQALRIGLDDVVDVTPPEGPYNRLVSHPWNGMLRLPLTRHVGPIQSFKLVVPPGRTLADPQVHEGHMWMFVLSGRLRLTLADGDIQLRVGESAEFSTRLPHWFGNDSEDAAEAICFFGRQGERIRPRVVPSTAALDSQRALVVDTPDAQPGMRVGGCS